LAIFQFGDDAPRIAPTAWVAESAQVIGRVELAAEASVWYGCVLRGDNEWIRIGARSNVQDGSVMHTDTGTVGDGSLIGMQSVVLNGARIGRHCLLAAGAVVPEGKVFEDGWLIIGAPAKAVRPLEPDQLERMRQSAAHYLQQTQRHRTLVKRIG
jgi:carbonic anhydrase/acetyltransferase-like protein (isoleucine patch superfamily)